MSLVFACVPRVAAAAVPRLIRMPMAPRHAATASGALHTFDFVPFIPGTEVSSMDATVERTDVPKVLRGLEALCTDAGQELTRAWRDAAPQLSGDVNAQRDALAKLVIAASTLEQLPLARRLLLRLLAILDEAQESSHAGPKPAIAAVPIPVWTALVAAHARAGDVDAGFALLGRLEALSSTPSAPSSSNPSKASSFADVPVEVFDGLICGLVDARRSDLAFETFRRVRTWALVEPTESMYIAMLRACALARDPDRALTLFDELAARHGEPSADARAQLIVALASRSRTARAAFRTFGESGRRSDPLTADMARALAAACARSGFSEEAKLLRRRMRASGLAADADMQAHLVRAFGVAAVRCSSRIESNVPSAGTAGDVHAMGADDDATDSRDAHTERMRLFSHAWGVVREAHDVGLVPLAVLNALLSAYCSAGLVEHAGKLLDMYQELAGQPPDTEAFARVLDALASDPRRFRLFWSDILSRRGVNPTEAMLRQALEVSLQAKDAQWVHSVLQLMYSARIAPSLEAAALIRAMRGQAGSGVAEVKALMRALEMQFGPLVSAGQSLGHDSSG